MLETIWILSRAMLAFALAWGIIGAFALLSRM